MDLTQAEDVKKRWQEYTEPYRKDLYNPDNHDGVIINVKPDILECKVTWALGNITKKNLVEVRNRFKGLDLIDRVPDELWNEVHDIVQKTEIKTIPMEKKRKKAK